MAWLIGDAFASGMPQQQAYIEPIAWYWLALAAIGIGVFIALSFTQGIKSWRKEHKDDPLKDSEVRLVGRIFAMFFTSLAWLIIATMADSKDDLWLIGGGLGIISAGVAPLVWKYGMDILKMIKPDWVKRLSAQ